MKPTRAIFATVTALIIAATILASCLPADALNWRRYRAGGFTPETIKYLTLPGVSMTPAQIAALDANIRAIKYGLGLTAAQQTERFDILLRRKMAFNLYANWPSTANRATYFDDTATGDGYQAGANPNLSVTMNPSPGVPAFLHKRFTATPTNISTAQLLWQIRVDAGQPIANDVLYLRFRDSSGTMLVQLAITFGDLSGATGTATFKITSNLDSTGYTLSNILVKTGGAQIQTYSEIRANPATGKANFGIGRADSTDLGDGVTAIEHESVATSDIDYSGDIYDCEVMFSAANLGQCDLVGISIAENPFVQIGDSISTNLAWGMGKQSTTSPGSGLFIPYLYAGRGGRYLHSVDNEGIVDANHWKLLTYNQGYRRIIVGNIGSNDYGQTGSALEATIKGYFLTILDDLSTQAANLDRVIVHSISPKGATNPRNAATITAVQATNTYISGLAATYGFGYYDDYSLMRDGTTDNWQAAYTSDGTHPNTVSGYTTIANGLSDTVLWGSK